MGYALGDGAVLLKDFKFPLHRWNSLPKLFKGPGGEAEAIQCFHSPVPTSVIDYYWVRCYPASLQTTDKREKSVTMGNVWKMDGFQAHGVA